MKLIFYSLAADAIGSNKLWIIGDNFAAESFRNHFKKYDPPGSRKHYIKENFKYQPFLNSRYSSPNTNMLARIRNCFAVALNSAKDGLFPHYILVVLDDDLISYLDCKVADGVASLFGIWIDWLVKEINDMIKTWLSQIPLKSKKILPFVYWVTAPIHSYFSKQRNNLRIKFNLSLESVVHQQENMRVIKMKDWEMKDSMLVINDRITEFGMTSYWLAVDSTFRYNCNRRENFLASKKSPSQSAVPSQNDNKAGPSQTDRSSQQSYDYSKDPMRSFFRRHRNSYEGDHMDPREDHRRSSYRSAHPEPCNCFILPRPRFH